MALYASQLSYSYPSTGRCAIKHISLKILPGEIVLITGKTGSGKSTLMKLLSGILAPDSGYVQFDNREIAPSDCGLVLQNPYDQLFAETLGQDVMFGPLNFGSPYEQAELVAKEALYEVSLNPEEFFERSVVSLSGGQSKAGSLAGVLAFRPHYYIFDEPSAGLDSSMRRQLRELVRKLADSGAAVLIVSHDIEEFLPYADGLLLMKDGASVWQGPSAHVLDNPQIFRLADIEPPEILLFQEELAKLSGQRFIFTLDPAQLSLRVQAVLNEYHKQCKQGAEIDNE